MKFEDYSRTFLHFYTEELPPLLLKHLPTKEFSLADLGAGDGALLVALQRGGYLTKAKNLVAVDISEERCSRLRQCTELKVLCSDVTAIPELENDSFDYIINTQVIEHVDERKLLTEIGRLMRKDGAAYIASVVRKKYGWWYYKTADGKWALDPTHLREYASDADFEGVLRAHGFEVVETKISPLRLSILEFIVRRVIAPIFKQSKVNDIFLKYPSIDYLRKNLTIHPPGYFIVESVVRKN